MANITLSIDDATLEAAREYAREQGWSLNELVRRLIQRTLSPDSNAKLQAVFDRAKELNCKSDGPWTREEIYDRPVLRRH